MKKSKITLSVLAAFALMSAALAVPSFEQASADTIPVNNAYVISAVGSDEESGNAFAYVETKTDDVVMTFDLLKGVKSGYFGIVDTLTTGYENYLTRDNFTMFSPSGEQIKSNKLKAGEMTFDGGYNYQIKILKENKTKTMTVSRKILGDSDAEYEETYSSVLSSPFSGVFGLALQSDGADTATVVLDNLKLTSAGSTLIDLDFDSDSTSEKTLTLYSDNANSSMTKYDTPQFKVSFYDLSGNLLKQTYVCEGNYTTCDGAPAVEGKEFKNWSESTVNVQRDLIVYPVYGEPEIEAPDDPVQPEDPIDPEQPEDPEQPKDPVQPEVPDDPVQPDSNGNSGGSGGNESNDGGCGGSLVGLGSMLALVTIAAVTIRKGGKKE